jgi:hypothetical protein
MVHAAAMHEAGHVVAALSLGFDVRFAVLSVRDDHTLQGVSGYTEVALRILGGPFDSPERAKAAATTPDVLRVRTMQVFAGRIAESFVNETEQDLDKGSEDDDKRAFAFARLALGPASTSTEWTEYVNDRYEEMSRELAPMSLTVRCVANYLIDHANENVPGHTLMGCSQKLSKTQGVARTAEVRLIAVKGRGIRRALRTRASTRRWRRPTRTPSMRSRRRLGAAGPMAYSNRCSIGTRYRVA